MRLEDLFPNVLEMSFVDKVAYINAYRLSRDRDMQKPSTNKKSKVKRITKALKLPRLLKKDLSTDFLSMMKVLDLTVTEVNKLRQECYEKGGL